MTAGRTWTALGTTVHLLVDEAEVLTAAEELLRAQLDELDRACSRFRPDSELSLLRPGSQRVGPLLEANVQAAIAAAAETGGLVDPTLGRSLAALGYDRTFASLPLDGPAGVAVPGRWQELRCQDGAVELPAGVLLDLGATAKAWAADRAAASIAQMLSTSVLVNLGGDLAVAGPGPETPAGADGPSPAVAWPVDAAGDVVAVSSGGLATSSTRHRTWVRDGEQLHHVLDPRSGRPAQTPWSTVTVAAPSCVEANAASTAAVVLAEDAPAWLAECQLPARLVAHDGHVVYVGGWPQQQQQRQRQQAAA